MMCHFVSQWISIAAISKKRMEENKKLNQGLEKYTKEQNQYVHKKEEVRWKVTFISFFFCTVSRWSSQVLLF